MPKLNKNVTVAAPKKRIVKQRVAPFVPSGVILVPSEHDMLLYAPPHSGLYLPKPADIDYYGRATHIDSIGGDTMPVHDNDAANPRNLLVPINPPEANNPVATSTVPDLTERELAKRAAAKAVAEFYSGVSMPFKAAVDLRYRAAVNGAPFIGRNATERHAAALAVILVYCAVNSDGTFVRGSGRIPRRMLGLTERPDDLLSAGCESGVLSNLIGTGAVEYVSGPVHGIGAETATYRVNYQRARNTMLAHNSKQPDGEHKFSRALALLDATINH